MSNEIKKRFNIIDVVLILAILAVVAGLFIRSGLSDKINNTSKDGVLEYTFTINSIKNTSEECFGVGKKIYSQTTQNVIGEIVEFSTRPAEAYIETSTGDIVKTIIPERIDVIATSRVEGSITSEGRCMLGGTTHIAAGKEIFARLDNITFMFTIDSVRYISDKTA